MLTYIVVNIRLMGEHDVDIHCGQHKVDGRAC